MLHLQAVTMQHHKFDSANAAQEEEKTGWGARDRTWEWRNQNPLPYRLATPHHFGW